ncbi:hypothetical protein Tco_0897580 [Tanacetum coccineum]
MAAAMKHMASNFAKLDKFEMVDFRRWQKKMRFLLSSMSVVYVLTTPMPEDGGNNSTAEQAKYMAEDASSKKFLVSNFTNYKMNDLRPVLEQYNELLGILRRTTNQPKGNNVAGPSVVNMVKHNNSSRYNDNKVTRSEKLGHNANVHGTNGSMNDIDVAWRVVDLTGRQQS